MDIKRADGGGSEFGLAVQIGTLSLPGNPHVESKKFHRFKTGQPRINHCRADAIGLI
jgi:hypothetical protein